MARLEITGTKLPRDEVKGVVLTTLGMRLKDLEKALDKLGQKISEFESKHGASSEEFLERYKSAQLEDNLDFFEWETCLVLRGKLSKEREALREILM